MKDKNYFVYILTNRNNSVLYVGMTSDLAARVYQHKNKRIEGFTRNYNVTKLVYFEQTSDAYSACSRERQLKKWSRKKKNALVNGTNPEWLELTV